MSQKAFQALLDSLTADEREKVMKVAMAYGLGPDDPAWVILAINQSGLIAIKKTVVALTELHKSEIKAFEQKAQKVAEVSMDKASKAAIKNISETLAITAQSLYRKRELKVTTTWTVCAAVIGVSFYAGISLFTYQFIESTFYKKALTDAYQIAYDEKARASWANTAIGKMAFELSQSTDISQLATCRRPGSGWQLNNEGTVCYPNANSDRMVYGWGVPKNIR
ncbi:MAG TPA: DUF6753 family protein [Methylobacter sp.]|jgi:hypothetical protein